MEALGKLTAFILLLVAALVTSILGAYIIYDIAQLYRIFTELTIVQVYGGLCIFTLITTGIARSSDFKDTSKDSAAAKGFARQVTTVVAYLLTWGIAHIMHNILT